MEIIYGQIGKTIFKNRKDFRKLIAWEKNLYRKKYQLKKNIGFTEKDRKLGQSPIFWVF